MWARRGHTEEAGEKGNGVHGWGFRADAEDVKCRLLEAQGFSGGRIRSVSVVRCECCVVEEQSEIRICRFLRLGKRTANNFHPTDVWKMGLTSLKRPEERRKEGYREHLAGRRDGPGALRCEGAELASS